MYPVLGHNIRIVTLEMVMNHWILRHLARWIGLIQGHSDYFAATSDDLPSHPASKDGEPHVDFCFTLVRAHQCGILMVDVRWLAACTYTSNTSNVHWQLYCLSLVPTLGAVYHFHLACIVSKCMNSRYTCNQLSNINQQYATMVITNKGETTESPSFCLLDDWGGNGCCK